MAVVGVVGHEDALSPQCDVGVAAVVMQQAFGFDGDAGQRDQVAQVVAVDHVQRYVQFQRRLDGIHADQVAAVDDGFGALGLGESDRFGEHGAAVVAVGNDADLHTMSGP